MNGCRSIAKVGLVVLIPVLLMLFYNQLANWHYHVLTNGMVVKHAHPYDKPDQTENPANNHKHSDSEFFFFYQFSDLASLLTFLLFAMLIFTARSHKSLYDYYNSCLHQQQLRNLRLLRAPPAPIAV